MGSFHKREKEIKLTILDVLCLVTLPIEHQYSYIAAQLITNGNIFPIPIIRIKKIIRFLSNTTDEENDHTNNIIREIDRQIQIKTNRLSKRRDQVKGMAIGCQLKKEDRLNKLGSRIFGNTSNWISVGKALPRIHKPRFNWVYKADDGTLVAGVDDISNEIMTGFVFHNIKVGIVRFVALAKSTNSVTEIFNLLGLHPRFLKNNLVKIDWNQRGFTINDSNYLPWVHYL
jgi:hypothetical protein